MIVHNAEQVALFNEATKAQREAFGISELVGSAHRDGRHVVETRAGTIFLMDLKSRLHLVAINEPRSIPDAMTWNDLLDMAAALYPEAGR